MNEQEVRVVLVTFPDETTALKIARSLVDARLAACVNIVPGAKSVYRWETKLEESAECLAFIKTTACRVPSLQEKFVDLHPYDVPEFLVLNVESGTEAYLKWVGEF